MTVLKDVILLSSVCRQYAESIDRDVAKTETDVRKLVFWNIHNRVRITEEILTFYEKAFSENNAESENSERLVIVTKDMFIDVVSAIEKSMKDILKLYPKSALKETTLEKGSHLYLRSILESCLEKGLIDKGTFDAWDAIFVMRNLAVHNNCVSDRTGTVVINGVTIKMKAGRMMKGPLNTYVAMTSSVVSLFYSWVTMMEEKFKA